MPGFLVVETFRSFFQSITDLNQTSLVICTEWVSRLMHTSGTLT